MSEQAWKCRADAYADPPRDCNFPYCGCDPGAEKVLDSIREEGYLSPEEADELRAQLKAKDEALANALRLMEEYRTLCLKAQDIAARAVSK